LFKEVNLEAMKKIKQIINSRDIMMGDIQLGQPLPVPELRQVSPFILIHHGEPKEQRPGEKGIKVGAHPHRGFEPVSFIFHGEVEHRDSMGNVNVVRDGGVQWLTAGKGVMHSEAASKAFQKKGGKFEMIQLWINLPKELKMIEPNYQGFNREDIPFYEQINSRVNVISGKIGDIKGPFESITGVMALTIEMQAKGEVNLDVPEGKNVILYQLSGATDVNDKKVDAKQLVVFEQSETKIKISSTQPTTILFLVGDPIDEPLATYGPFVMNTNEETMQAVMDFQTGKMGELVD